MKLAQYKIKWLARLMLVLVLFAQGIVAANACVAPNASAVQAYTMQQQDHGAMPCHEADIPNANACLSHCTLSDQISVDQHDVPITAPVSVISRVSVQPQLQSLHLTACYEHLVLDTGPPIPIRYCSLLN